MSEEKPNKMVNKEIAKPLHYQQLERSLNIQPFLSFVDSMFKEPIRDEERTTDSDGEGTGNTNAWNGIPTTKQDRRSDRMRLYNFAHVQSDRVWLQNILVSDSSDSGDDSQDEPITEEYFQEMLKLHLYKKKYQQRFYSNPENRQYQYYGAGLLSNYDKFQEHQTLIVGNKKKKKSVSVKKEKNKKNDEKDNQQSNDTQDFESPYHDENTVENKPIRIQSPASKPLRSKKKTQQAKNPEIMAHRRRKIWGVMAKKEMGKVQRARLNNHKEVLTSCRRVAQYCMRFWRQKAMQSQKNMKETIWRAKRLTREMQVYWRRYDRVERETRRRMEKEAEEQRKMDVELMEAKRQQRKLNFLITQTELYAHFMSRKLGGGSTEEQLRILSQLEEEKNPRLAAIDDYDSEVLKEKVKQNVHTAVQAEEMRSRQFGMPHCLTSLESEDKIDEERPQPTIFKGSLKGYQLKGMNWLANLYDQGINGILADEMGLGKTVQSIAFLCHIAEKYSVWGPFLIISPASTLHNWQQEMARFVPDFKVVPYWGSPQERKILRQFWDQKDLHTQEASFHVVITSYQLVITDFKYFNRIKWQYLILDEAQAIKSTSSVRWKLLLGFSCRNRLLLSGTPIQNSMAELWALLHFIMPTMFDSHDEFNEWFSKDIESHAENKTSIDEKHLSRLHLILKPFMLRRIKKDVENELSDKIEIMVCCPLTTRQKMLYGALKKKIRIEDLLHSAGPYQSSQSITSSLMNLVMQFRKVCNHPELFERREAKSPFYGRCSDGLYVLPKLLFEEGILYKCVPSVAHLLYNKFCIANPEYIHRSMFPLTDDKNHSSNFFSFTTLIGLFPQDVYSLVIGGLLKRWLDVISVQKKQQLRHHRRLWWEEARPDFLLLEHSLPEDLMFTTNEGSNCVFSHTCVKHYSMPETIEHRLLRSRKLHTTQHLVKLPERKKIESNEDKTMSDGKELDTKCGKEESKHEENKLNVLPEFKHISRPPRILECHPTHLPSFLYNTSPKVQTCSWEMYCSCRSFAWWWLHHQMCTTKEGLDAVWYGSPELAADYKTSNMYFHPPSVGGLMGNGPLHGWSNIIIPVFGDVVTAVLSWPTRQSRSVTRLTGLMVLGSRRRSPVRSCRYCHHHWTTDKETLVTDAGKLYVLDGLLKRLKEQGHRVLIYSQMTRMIDLLEEYMWHRKLTYMRLDGSSKISERRDMVADFQSRADIFVFLLSTRAGGLGINLTAADTVIFYDSDWNPTVDQQAMDRAHRLGQTKQVTVYRLICKGTIEERILQRAREKSEIQRMVISGGNFKPDTLKPKEVVSLLLDDEEIEQKYRQKQAERRQLEETRADTYKERDRERKRKQNIGSFKEPCKQIKLEEGLEETILTYDSAPVSPAQSDGSALFDETSSDTLVVDVDGPIEPLNPVRHHTSKRGRPRSARRGGLNRVTSQLPSLVAGTSTLTTTGTGMTRTITVKRGPGRPRLRPSGPAHQGIRGSPRQRGGVRPNTPSSIPPVVSEPIKPFGYYTQDLELTPIDPDIT